jgi:hypothetical protein
MSPLFTACASFVWRSPVPDSALPVLLWLATPLLDAPVVGFVVCQVHYDPAVFVLRCDHHNSKSSSSAALFS